jgi:AcrR family transcriptional regulator
MGRRNLHSKTELQELILQAAYELINKTGLQSVTARNIAAKIGYTPGTLYHAFENLDDILIHLKSKALDKFKIFFEEYFSNKNFSIEEFIKFYIEYCNKFEQDWSLLPAWYQEKISNTFKYLVSHIAAFTGCDLKRSVMITKLVWSSCQGLCSLSTSGKLELIDEKDLESLCSEFSIMFNNYQQKNITE